MTREKKIKIFVFIILIGFIVSVFYHYVLGEYFGKSYPSNTFLFTPSDRLMDFINVYNSGSSVYFPFGNLIINFFCLIKPLKLSLILFLSLSIVTIAYYFWKNLQGKCQIDSISNTLVFTFFTFPVLFLIDRANFESFVFIFLCLFVYLYQRGKINYAIIPLSFAIAMKLFPAVFLVLLFSDRKYKQIIWTTILVLILTLFSSWLLNGGIIEYFSQLANNANFYQENYVIGNGGFDFGHSLFGLFKCVMYSINLGFIIPYLMKPYSILVLVLASFISIYIIYIEKDLWKKIALLVFTMCLLPHVSADYKLIYLFIPIFVYINTKSDDPQFAIVTKKKFFKNGDFLEYIYVIIFGLLLIPKNYRLFVNIYDGVYLDPILMLLLAFFIIRSGISGVNPEKKERIRKIEKVSLYVFIISILVSIMLVIGGIWFLFTPKGNDITKSYLTAYLTKRFNTTVQFDSLRFSTKNVYVDLDMTSIAKIHFALGSKNDTLMGNYKFDFIDASKISKRFGEKFEFSTYGEISGSGINNIQINGVTNIFHGAGKYHIELMNRKISKIGISLIGIQVEEVLTAIIKKGDGIVGTADLRGDVFVENLRPTIGHVRFSADSLVVNDSSTFSKLVGISVPNSTKVNTNTVTLFNGQEAVSKINVISKIAQITLLENRINLKTRDMKSDYLIEIYNLKDINIRDSANIVFINNQLPNLKRFKYMLDGNCQGEVLIAGHLNRNNISKVSVDGDIFDLSGNAFNKSNYKTKIFPFRLENGNLTVSDSTYKN